MKNRIPFIYLADFLEWERVFSFLMTTWLLVGVGVVAVVWRFSTLCEFVLLTDFTSQLSFDESFIYSSDLNGVLSFLGGGGGGGGTYCWATCWAAICAFNLGFLQRREIKMAYVKVLKINIFFFPLQLTEIKEKEIKKPKTNKILGKWEDVSRKVIHLWNG